MLNVVHVPYYYNVFNCVDCLLAKFSFSVLAGVRVLGLKENNQIHVKLLTGSLYSVYFLLSLTFTDRHGPAQEAFQVWCLAQEQFNQKFMMRLEYVAAYTAFFSVRANVTNGVMATPAHST